MATGTGSTCARCGTSLAPDMRFCPSCGAAGAADAAPLPGDDPGHPGPTPWELDAAAREAREPPAATATTDPSPAPAARRRRSARAVVAAILGAVGIVIGGLVLGPLAMILGMVARRDVRLDPHLSGERFATAGIVLGAIALAWHVLLLVNLLGTD